MKRVLSSAFIFMLLLVSSRSVQAQCNQGATGECDEEHDSAGCRVTECCEVVCEVDPICCELQWDKICVVMHEDLCGGYACPGVQSCDASSDEPGCSDAECCRLVCNHDYFCCWVEWDAYCIAFTEVMCGVVPCEIEIPAGTPQEEEFCYERINEGCNFSVPTFAMLPCGSAVAGTCSTDTPRDTDWYSLEVVAPMAISVTLRAEFPAQIVLLSGPCDGPLEAHVLAATTACGQIQFEADIEPGTWSLVVSPGLLEAPLREGMTCDLEDPDDPPDGSEPPPEPSYFGLRYLLSFDCTLDDLPGDLNGDGVVDGADIVIVLGWWGSANPIADIDGNGVVDGADLLIVLAYWTG